MRYWNLERPISSCCSHPVQEDNSHKELCFHCWWIIWGLFIFRAWKLSIPLSFYHQFVRKFCNCDWGRIIGADVDIAALEMSVGLHLRLQPVWRFGLLFLGPVHSRCSIPIHPGHGPKPQYLSRFSVLAGLAVLSLPFSFSFGLDSL